MQIIGTTLDTIGDMLTEILQRSDALRGPVTFSIYHLGPYTLRGWPIIPQSPPASWESEARDLETRIGLLKKLASDKRNVTINFIAYRHAPPFYAWVIGAESIFWGPCTWIADTSKFDGGGTNFCYQILKGNKLYGDFSRWITNRCELYELWHDKDELHSLGYMGGLKDKEALTEILASLPQTTRCIRTLFLSGETCMGDKRVIENLRSLLEKEPPIMLECLSMYRNSDFVTRRASEVKSTEEILRSRIDQAFGRVQAEFGSTASIAQYDQWGIWYMVFVDDERVYVGFYSQRDHPPSGDSPVWIFKKDTKGRSIFWPLMKEYLSYKFYIENPKDHYDQREIGKLIEGELAKLRA